MKTAYIVLILGPVLGVGLPAFILARIIAGLFKTKSFEGRLFVKSFGIFVALICIVFSVELLMENPGLMFPDDVSVGVDKVTFGEHGRVLIKGAITNISDHATNVIRAGNDVVLFELNESEEPKEIYPLMKFGSIFEMELKPAEHYPFNASFPATLFQDKAKRFVVGAVSGVESDRDKYFFSQPFTVPRAFFSRTHILIIGTLLCLVYFGLYWHSLPPKA